MGSRAGEITLDWGGEADRLFRFGIGELRKIQEELDAGPTGIAARCMLSLAALEALRTSDFQALAHLSSARLLPLVHGRGPGAGGRTAGGVRGGGDDALPDGKLRFADYYGAGAVIGLSARDVDDSSLWEIAAQSEAWARANGGDADKGPPSPEEHDALVAKYA
jgi:hypothetical protein